jgi:hypothetical protein
MHRDLGLYALGALDDAADFESHYQTCSQCQEELAGIGRSLQVVGRAIGDPQPPAGLKQRTLAAVRFGRIDPTPVPAETTKVRRLERRGLRRSPRLLAGLAVAAVVVSIAAIGVRTIFTDRFQTDRAFALSAPPGGGAATGSARVDDTPSGSIVELTVHGLPDAPSGYYYECWFVGEGDGDDIPNRVSAGTFRAGNGTFRMRSSADPERFPKMGVTLEPDDGNPARTGPKVLITVPKT